MDILEGLNVTGLQISMLITIVAGVTELYARVIARDWKTVGKIVVAVVTATLIGLDFGLEFVQALAVGFIPSGTLTVLGKFGNKSEATPTTVTGKSLPG